MDAAGTEWLAACCLNRANSIRVRGRVLSRRYIVTLIGGALLASAAGAADAGLQPGMWEMTTRLTAMSAPGVPASVLKAALGKTNTNRHCVGAHEAGHEVESLLGPSAEGCKADKRLFSGGKINIAIQCNATGDKSTGTLIGTYTSSTLAMTYSTVSASGRMTMAATGRRVGTCS